jgi:acyl-CoA synthetase (AMP-forming)/AMP-acid ligase II/thioesterase domain-containing protein
LVRTQALCQPDAWALGAPGRRPLTFAQLQTHVDHTVATLNEMGIGLGDRVAVVIPNGSEMAAAFVTVASGATCAPLNPAYRPEEFEFYLTDLGARALIVQADCDSPARVVAQRLGIPQIELWPSAEAEAGMFELRGQAGRPASRCGYAQPDDVALVLHTSGTTSRPKIVPLSHRNLCISAANIRAAYQLGARDRCLNVMPLFHIHGLVGAVLSSLSAGASVMCTPGFYATRFFEWLQALKPTWYTAVPSMHQAILARAAAHQDIIANHALRFLRSASSPLPPQVMAELERVFHAPVLEAYGKTEASHQMASNPLPPHRRKPGSVGRPTGLAIAIMNGTGALLPAGARGEVVIRGDSVTRGYENNLSANQDAFQHGWFRTGDQGYLDDEGYLFLTGRVKEIINRGGEKISPREIDEVLLDHPAVAQAVTFPVPHAKLGEDVGAAVVLRDDRTATPENIRAFVATRLTYSKAPRKLLILPELPKGSTGKLQRIGLADKLGLASTDQDDDEPQDALVAPRTSTETALARMWMELLRIDRVGVNNDFFRLGGDSVLAAGLFTEIHQTFGKDLPMATLLNGATIEHLARMIDNPATSWSSLVELQAQGACPPFFLVHGVGGEVASFKELARHLAVDMPFYGIQAPHATTEGTSAPSIETIAAHYLKEVRQLQPRGPYFLGGYSMGSTIAFEMAQQLGAQAQEVAMLAIVDSTAPGKSSQQGIGKPGALRQFFSDAYYYLTDDLARLSLKELWQQTKNKTLAAAHHFNGLFLRHKPLMAGALRAKRVFEGATLAGRFRRVVEAHYQALLNYNPRPFKGRLTLFRARGRFPLPALGADLGWRPLAGSGTDVVFLPGNHETILKQPCVRYLGERLVARLRAAQDRVSCHPR